MLIVKMIRRMCPVIEVKTKPLLSNNNSSKPNLYTYSVFHRAIYTNQN